MTERIAYICEHKDCKPPLRVFIKPGDPAPRCPGHGKMARQANKPYGAGGVVPIAPRLNALA